MITSLSWSVLVCLEVVELTLLVQAKNCLPSLVKLTHYPCYKPSNISPWKKRANFTVKIHCVCVCVGMEQQQWWASVEILGGTPLSLCTLLCSVFWWITGSRRIWWWIFEGMCVFWISIPKWYTSCPQINGHTRRSMQETIAIIISFLLSSHISSHTLFLCMWLTVCVPNLVAIHCLSAVFLYL